MLDDGGGVGTQAALAADPDDPVDDHVGQVRARDVGDHAAALREQAARPRRCTVSPPSRSASTPAPRRASAAPAYSASPPLSPEPTSSRTRRP